MHNPEFILENERHKIHWYLEVQTNRLILARRLDPVIYNKAEDLPNSGFGVQADHEVKLKAKREIIT